MADWQCMANRQETRMRGKLAMVAVVATVAAGLSGCAQLNDWWVGEAKELSRKPPGSTEYRCAAGKAFFLRVEPGGKSAWLILPEREFRLDQVSTAQGARYSNGRTTLNTKDDDAAIDDAGNVTYADCKAKREG
jgi:membrane-bound inhibitor of C-type lysozyme